MRTALVLVGVSGLSGCLYTHEVEVDRDSVTVPRGTSSPLRISVDGEAMADLDGVLWEVADPRIATVTPALDGLHFDVGGDAEGTTTIRFNVHGQTAVVETFVGAPALVKMWVEPTSLTSSIGDATNIRALALDTVFHLRDITADTRWAVRDTSVATLDTAGMLVIAEHEGSTTLHANYGDLAAIVPITILK